MISRQEDAHPIDALVACGIECLSDVALQETQFRGTTAVPASDYQRVSHSGHCYPLLFEVLAKHPPEIPP